MNQEGATSNRSCEPDIFRVATEREDRPELVNQVIEVSPVPIATCALLLLQRSPFKRICFFIKDSYKTCNLARTEKTVEEKERIQHYYRLTRIIGHKLRTRWVEVI